MNQLRWYFKQRRAKELNGTPIDDQESYDDAHFAFRAARYQVLYRRWLNDGDAALDVMSSATIAEAINRGSARLEYDVLPFSYHHLAPLVGSTRPLAKGADEGEEHPARPRPLWRR
jgi:hypothetical protein